jgi:hypothetical protein
VLVEGARAGGSDGDSECARYCVIIRAWQVNIGLRHSVSFVKRVKSFIGIGITVNCILAATPI